MEYENDDDAFDPEREPDEEDEAPQLIASREDFDAVLDDFLDNYELVGNKVRPVLPGSTGAEKLDTLRRAMGTDSNDIKEIVNNRQGQDILDDILMPSNIEDKRDRWDCETILSA